MIALSLALLLAQDWNQWRGANRDGVVPAAQSPATWPKDLRTIWKVPAGSGYSSPVVSGGFAFVFSRNGDQETLTKHSLTTGAASWTHAYPAPFHQNSYAKEMSKGPFSTPLVLDGRVYTLGVTAILTSWNASTGAVLWRRDFSSTVDTSKLFTGTAMSPVLEAGVLIVHTGDDRGSTVQGLDPATGKEKWILRMTAGPGYASPIVYNGQVITMTSNSLVGIQAATGKLAWTFPWKDEWLENIITPVRAGDLLVFSGVRRGSVALRLSTNGPPQQAWSNPDVAFYMSSPVTDGAYLYGLGSKKKGQYLCVDAKTGRIVWATNGREALQAAVLQAGAHLLWMTNDGDLVVSARSSRAFEQIARYSVSDAPVWTQPVVLGRRILVKSDNALTLWSLD
jgi:outer membrane protein assembly factor BamB